MRLRDLLFVVLLCAAAGLVTTGAALVHPAAGFVVAGLSVALLAFLFLTDDTPTPGDV